MFYSKPLLKRRFKEEKFRSYRTGSHFSLVLFNPFQLICDGYKRTDGTINSLIKLLDQETRLTDIKGWWGRSTIAVLLLDTSGERTLLFIDKLVSKIQKTGYASAESIHKGPFKIFTFPNTQWLNTDVRGNKKDEASKESRNNPNQNRHICSSINNLQDWDISNGNDIKPYQKLIKRNLDVIISVIGLIVFSPLFLLVALLIKLDSPGPVLFRQKRIGQGGKCFTFLKFRSMYNNANEEIHKNHVKSLVNEAAGISCNGYPGNNSYKLTQDKRITRVGRFLRKTSIDEIPQLINVLKGDITLVGPRPHPVYEVAQYNLWQRHRLEVKPGVTGLGQIYGRFNIAYEDVHRIDLRYLKSSNLFLDLKILLKTIPVVLSCRGAQ